MKKKATNNLVTVNFSIPVDLYLKLDKSRFKYSGVNDYPVSRSKYISLILQVFLSQSDESQHAIIRGNDESSS